MAQSDESALLVRMEASLAKFEKQMAKGYAAADKAANMIEGRLGTMGNKVAKSAESSANAMVKDLDALRSKYDPLFAASKKYETELEQVNRAWKVGAINAQQHGAAVDRLNAQYLSLSSAADAVGDSALRQGNTTRMFAQQLSQVGQQTMATGNFMQALAIQLPDMGLAFGAVGAAVGLLAGIALPMLWNAMGGGIDITKELKDQMGNLEAATAAYVQAASDAATPTDQLIEKYGRMSAQAQLALVAMADVAKANALSEFATTIDQVSAAFLELRTYASSDLLGVEESALALKDTFGLTYEQVGALRSALVSLTEANSLPEMATSATAVSAAIMDAYGSVEQMPPVMQALYAEMGGIVAQAAELDTAIQAASWSLSDLSTIASGLAGYFSAADGAAAGLANTLARAASNAWDMAKGRAAAQNYVDNAKTIGAYQLYANTRSAAPDAPVVHSGGGRKGGGGGGKAADPQSIFDSSEASIQRMQREIELLGRNSQEVAKLKAEWAMLDAAKKQGVDLDKVAAGSSLTLREQIEAQAESVAKLTLELEAQKVSRDKFEKGITDISSAMANALVGGQSLRDGLADVFRGIALDLAKSGIQKGLMSLFGGIGGGGGFLGGLFGGGAAVQSFDGGGWTGNGARSGGVDGKGGFPAILHPRERVVDATKGGQGGGRVEIILRPEPGTVAVIARNEANAAISQAGPALVQRSVAASSQAARQSKSFFGAR